MSSQHTYAPAPLWDIYFAADAAAGKDLNPDCPDYTRYPAWATFKRG